MSDDSTASDFGADWVAALNELHDIAKDQTADAGSYRYAYANLAAATTAARSVLGKHGLAVNQDAVTEEGHVAIYTTIWHRSGHRESFGPLRMPPGRGPQETGSAITYARRYHLMAVLGLATEDDDGKAAQQAAEAPHPLSDRVAAVQADLRRLTDADKETVKAWADGRKLSAAALLADERWLELVETQLDELQANRNTQPEEQ